SACPVVSVQTCSYVGLLVVPPMYPTAVLVTPFSLRKTCSTHQKHPAPNVAFINTLKNTHKLNSIWKVDTRYLMPHYQNLFHLPKGIVWNCPQFRNLSPHELFQKI